MMTDDELRSISAHWLDYEIVGHAQDGAEIRKIGRAMTAVREPSGYFCSPIAYSCRLADNGAARRWFT